MIIPGNATGRSTADPAASLLGVTDRLVLALLFIYLATEVFGGAVRYCLTLIGMPWLAYTPKVLVVVAYFGLVLKVAYKGRIGRTMLGALVLLCVFMVLGVDYTANWIQPLFGVFVLLPLLFAILAEPAFYRLGERIVPYAAALWFCAAFGLIYNYLVKDVPWSALNYQLAGVEVTATRAWTTFGIRRAAGFSRASFDVATQLLFLALPWVILGRRKVIAVVAWLATGVLIVLTTTKTQVGVYLFMTLMLPLTGVGGGMPKLKRMITICTPVVIVLVGIGLPVSSLFIDYQLNLNSYVSQFLLASFDARLTSTWPLGFSLVFDHGSAILGRGIGGVGMPQKYFEPLLYSPADNLYLYLYAAFGVIGLLIVGVYTASISKLPVGKDPFARLIWFWGVAILMSGWSVNCVESGLMSCLLGLTFAYARRRRLAAMAPLPAQTSRFSAPSC